LKPGRSLRGYIKNNVKINRKKERKEEGRKNNIPNRGKSKNVCSSLRM
jgi:hypothetical protein